MILFIAEICSNDSNNLDRAKKLIDKYNKIGCDAIEFQLFTSENLFDPEIIKKSKSYIKIKSFELVKSTISILSKYIKKKVMFFRYTLFDLDGNGKIKYQLSKKSRKNGDTTQKIV